VGKERKKGRRGRVKEKNKRDRRDTIKITVK